MVLLGQGTVLGEFAPDHQIRSIGGDNTPKIVRNYKRDADRTDRGLTGGSRSFSGTLPVLVVRTKTRGYVRPTCRSDFS